MDVQEFSLSVFVLLASINAIISAPSTSPRDTKPSSPTSTKSRLDDCHIIVQKIGTALGGLLLIETLFCCYVLFSWARNFRINSKKKMKIVDHQSKEDADGATVHQDKNQIPLEDYQPLDPAPPQGIASGLGYQPLSKKQREPRKGAITELVKLLEKHDDSTSTTRASTTTATARDNEDVGGLVYSQPYEDSVSAVSELKSKGAGSFSRKENKDSSPKDPTQLVYYHVLEETDANASSSDKEDVYYYCDSDNQENKTATLKTTPSKPLPFVPQEQPEDDVYYSGVEEDFTNKLACKISKKALVPSAQAMKERFPKAKSSTDLSVSQQQPYYHVLENQSECSNKEPTNKNSLKPLKGNAMLNAHMIQEMKNRVANKKSGD